MIQCIEKPLAFIWRDFINAATYKLAFIMQFFGIFISILTLFFLSKLLGDVGVFHLKPYGGNYFAFVLIGIAFFSYLGVSMKEVSKVIREGQMLGTLEALLVTQTNIPTIIISSTFYSFIWATFQVSVYLLLGTLLFGINLGNANIVSALFILFLTIISFSGIGIMSASFVMILKKGDPVASTSTAPLIGYVSRSDKLSCAFVTKLNQKSLFSPMSQILVACLNIVML